MLSAVRLLWACALMESARRDVASVARRTGFVEPKAMLAAARRHLLPYKDEASLTSLPVWRDALPYIVGSLGGHLTS
jgi:hypothetical protein